MFYFPKKLGEVRAKTAAREPADGVFGTMLLPCLLDKGRAGQSKHR